ncbi:MAG: hypothetical protein AABY01_04440, partial [Nanoarchaeota archaeon]
MPDYFAKIINLAGTTVARFSPTYDGGVGAIEFTETAFINGQSELGSFVIDLNRVTDPAYRYQVNLQNAIDREMRCEIYDNPGFHGDPVYTGVVTELPDDLEGRMQVRGVDIRRRLETGFKLRRYHQLSGNAATVAQALLSNYESVFKDNFNRTTGLGANWTLLVGTWDIVSNAAKVTTATASMYPASYTANQWANSRISFDMEIPTPGVSSKTFSVYLLENAGTLQNYYQLQFTDASISGRVNPKQIALWEDVAGSATQVAYREYDFPSDTRIHIDIYYSRSGNDHTIVVVMNNVEMLNVTRTCATINTSGAVDFTADQNSIMDNFVFATATAKLAAGTFDATTETLDQVFNSDSHLSALAWIQNKLGWESCVNLKAGAGNDQMDFQASIGTDWSRVLTLRATEDKKDPCRITNLQRHRATGDLATVLQTYGQSADDATANFASYDLDAMDTYGVIEDEYSDPRVIDSGTAKVIGDNELARRSGGDVSLTG